MNNTADFGGGNIYILDVSSVCNQINSSIIGGQAQQGGGVHLLMGKFRKMGHRERKWNDCGHCNIPATRFSEKRRTLWNCDIRNNLATRSGGGITIAILEFNYSAQVDFIDVRIVENTATYDSSSLVSIHDLSGRGGMVFIGSQKVYFGYGISGLTIFEDIFSVRQVELWKANTSLPPSINLHSFSTHSNPATCTSAFRIIFRNVTFINTPIQVTRGETHKK